MMTLKETSKLAEALREATKNRQTTKAQAREILVKSGLYTKKGKRISMSDANKKMKTAS